MVYRFDKGWSDRCREDGGQEVPCILGVKAGDAVVTDGDHATVRGLGGGGGRLARGVSTHTKPFLSMTGLCCKNWDHQPAISEHLSKWQDLQRDWHRGFSPTTDLGSDLLPPSPSCQQSFSSPPLCTVLLAPSDVHRVIRNSYFIVTLHQAPCKPY